MKRILLIAVLMMIGFCGVANAEGAWVLWQKSDITSTTWIIEGAFPSYDICIQNEISVCKKAASQVGGKCEAIEGEHFMFVSRDHSKAVGWMCLPESVDPRK